MTNLTNVMNVDSCVDELHRRGALPASVRGAFASGSIVRGWGNSTSDLDVYIVSDQAWSEAPDGVVLDAVPTTSFYVGDCRWDVEYWQTADVERLLRSVSWTAYDTGELSARPLGRHEVDFLEQMWCACPLVHPGWLAEQKEALSRSALRAHLVEQRLNLADVYVEDAAGQLDSGDVECAVLSARMALGHAVDALMASLGELGYSVKWRPKRFHVVDQNILSFADYWHLETMRDYDPHRPNLWVGQVLATCRLIAVNINA